MKPSTLPPAIVELARIARFGLVGVGATLTHLAGAELAVWLKVWPWLAFLLGFLPAFAVSYLGHRHFTFGHGSKDSLVKFFVVAVSGLVVGEIVLHALEPVPGFGAPLRILISVFVMPFVTYLAAKFWAFRA